MAAANEVEVDFDGLAPDQTWAGEPNDYIVRESYIYDVSLDAYNPVTLGEGGGSTGWELLEGPYTSELADGLHLRRRLLQHGLIRLTGLGRGRPRVRPSPAARRHHLTGATVLEIANLEVVYNDVILVLRGLSLTVPDGQIVALLGSNGAGKTTTLRAVSGLLDVHDGEITKGTVTFDGQTLIDGDAPSTSSSSASSR